VNLTKVLIILLALVIYTNYENYFKVDPQKLYREIKNLQTNIVREQNILDSNNTKKSLSLKKYHEMMFNAKQFNYSQAMGQLQNQINDAAKDNCKVKYVKWAQVPNTKDWYEELRVNTSLECSPKKLFIMTNKIKKNKILYRIENFRIVRNIKKEFLNINFQLIAFREKNES